jgi:histidine triad (HIT) family protein
MENCIFCKIIKNESPSYKFYEDENYIGILSIHPLNKGQSLVIPKKHYRWVWDSENIGQYFELTQKIVIALKKSFNIDFVIGAQVGEEVHHAHVQLIPRYENDGHGDFINTNIKQEFSSKEMIEIAKLIESNL